MSDRFNRRQFLTGAAALSAATLVPAAQAGQYSAPEHSPVSLPALTHTVFFWLKNPDSEQDRNALIEGIRTLGKIETVRGLHVGVPASTEKRDVVDNSYQVSELLMFDDVEGQNAYQVHPIHERFVKNYSHLWSKVVVYDSLAV